jgi:hypothetical protein
VFGLFGPEKVEYIDLSEAVLTYRSRKKKHKIGSAVKIGLLVPVDGAMQTLKLEVVIDSFRPLPDATSLVIGHVVAQPHELVGLGDLMSNVPRPDLGRLARRSERVGVSVRLLSQQLPGFRAVSVDLSLHGAQIQCEGLLEVNTYMNVTLELEMPDLPKLSLQALVIWARAEEERRKAYRAGLEFTQQHPEVQALWSKAYGRLLKMQGQSVLHKSLSGPDYQSVKE